LIIRAGPAAPGLITELGALSPQPAAALALPCPPPSVPPVRYTAQSLAGAAERQNELVVLRCFSNKVSIVENPAPRPARRARAAAARLQKPRAARAQTDPAPAQISDSSVVIFAWRLRLYTRLSDLRSSLALSEALDIAFMRAASSDASASWSERRSVAFR
jgi:hypothetical protein